MKVFRNHRGYYWNLKFAKKSRMFATHCRIQKKRKKKKEENNILVVFNADKA